jgi:hypothetical protein
MRRKPCAVGSACEAAYCVLKEQIQAVLCVTNLGVCKYVHIFGMRSQWQHSSMPIAQQHIPISHTNKTTIRCHYQFRIGPATWQAHALRQNPNQRSCTSGVQITAHWSEHHRQQCALAHLISECGHLREDVSVEAQRPQLQSDQGAGDCREPGWSLHLGLWRCQEHQVGECGRCRRRHAVEAGAGGLDYERLQPLPAGELLQLWLTGTSAQRSASPHNPTHHSNIASH